MLADIFTIDASARMLLKAALKTLKMAVVKSPLRFGVSSIAAQVSTPMHIFHDYILNLVKYF